jgi:hypothetical protein
LALWFGLATGFGEVMLLGLRRYVLHHFLFLGQDAAWMVPVADALCFLAVGLLLALAHRWWPRRFTAPAVAGVLTGLSIFALLLMYGPLHQVASILIAVGIGQPRGSSPPLDRLTVVGRTLPGRRPAL